MRSKVIPAMRNTRMCAIKEDTDVYMCVFVIWVNKNCLRLSQYENVNSSACNQQQQQRKKM